MKLNCLLFDSYTEFVELWLIRIKRLLNSLEVGTLFTCFYCLFIDIVTSNID